MDGYPRMGYLPCILRGISYGEQLTLDNAKIYSPELIENGGIEMFATKPLSQWHEPLGSDVTKILNSDFLAPPTFNGNTDIIKLWAAVEKNSLITLNAAKTPVKYITAGQMTLCLTATLSPQKKNGAMLH